MTGYLTAILFFPLLGVALLAGIPGANRSAIRQATLVISIVHFLIALPLWWLYAPGGPEYQFVERVPWIESLGVEYHLGVDGVSVLLTLLTVLLTPLAVLASWRYVDTTTLEIKLRAGVRFHDGTAFNAAAVKWNLERELDPANKLAQRANIVSVQSVQAPDDRDEGQKREGEREVRLRPGGKDAERREA